VYASDVTGPATDARPAGVRTFRVQMTVLIIVYTLLVYGGIFVLTRTLLLDSVSNQAESYTALILDTRAWNASHDGVWVVKSDGVLTNPYLAELGVPADIRTEDGTTLTLRNPAAMTREISEISRTHKGVWFHLSALEYTNPTNAPDDWERDALARIASGEATMAEGIGVTDGQRTYRMVTSLLVDSNCLQCHHGEGYQIGDKRGAVTVNIPMDRTDTQLRRAAGALAALGFLTLVLSLLALHFLLKRMEQRIEEANAQLARAAVTDALTGALNRGATIRRLAEEFERSRREGLELSVVMLDLDHFKRINDTFGHAAGDRALQEFVARMRASVRAYDIVGRIGGEEFLVVTPGTDASTALGLAERILDDVRNEPIRNHDVVTLTASAGVAEMLPTDIGIDTIIGRADVALYRAKDMGRDRAEKATDSD